MKNRTVPCAPWLKAQVAAAVAAEGYPVLELPSGAGHDGMAMVDIRRHRDAVRAMPWRHQPTIRTNMSIWRMSMPARAVAAGDREISGRGMQLKEDDDGRRKHLVT